MNEDMKFRAIEERFNKMQSMLEKLIAGLSETTDQEQTEVLARNLFNSGLLKIGTQEALNDVK